MSVVTLRRPKLKQRHVKPELSALEFKRPSDWLPLPDCPLGSHKIVMLAAVFNHDENLVSFSVNTTGGTGWTVDWGDGSAPTTSAGTATVSHNFNWAGCDPATLTSEGFRQALVVVTMNGGSLMTQCNLMLRHGATTALYSNPWLDIRMVGSEVTALTAGAAVSGVTNRLLRQFEYVGPAKVNAPIFQNCSALEKIIGTQWTKLATSMQNMFNGCTAIKTIPPVDMSAVTNVTAMFSGCSALVYLPALDTSRCTGLSSMFANCIALKEIPPIDTSICTTFLSTFSGCAMIRTVPMMNTSLVANWNSAFQSCTSLTTIPALDFSACTGFNNTFSGCTALQSIPLINLAALTVAPSSPFQNCYSLSVGATTGLKYGISYQNCRMSATELNRVYTNLGVASGAQTINVTSNPGVAGDDPTIATAKGWTVTGS